MENNPALFPEFDLNIFKAKANAWAKKHPIISWIALFRGKNGIREFYLVIEADENCWCLQSIPFSEKQKENIVPHCHTNDFKKFYEWWGDANPLHSDWFTRDLMKCCSDPKLRHDVTEFYKHFKFVPWPIGKDESIAFEFIDDTYGYWLLAENEKTNGANTFLEKLKYNNSLYLSHSYIKNLPQASNPLYLDVHYKDGAFFSKELSIAIETWMELYGTGGSFNSKLAHKTQIEKHLKKYSLSMEAAQRIIKIINPNKKGGAPKTEN